MNIANCLTVIRLFISPIFLLIYLEHDNLGISDQTLPYVLLGLFFIAELSDAFDGYLARKYNQVTDLGKVLDPMADSIFHISVFLTLTLEPVKLPMLLVFVILYRDYIVSTLRTLCALRGFTLAARWTGKIKAVTQAVTAFIIICLLIPHSQGTLSTAMLQWISTWLVALASVYTIFSGFDYLYSNRDYIQKALTLPKEA